MATVTAASGSPRGSVEFFDASTGSDLGLGTLINTGGNTGTWSLATTSAQLQVTGGNADIIRAVYQSNGDFLGSNSTLLGGESVAPLALAVSGITVANKTYDQTTGASLNCANGILVGLQNGDAVALNISGALGTFTSKDAGTGIAVIVSGLTLTGAQARNYVLMQPVLAGNITPLQITVAGVTANNKVYDGTTAATLNLGGAVPSGVFSGDSIFLASTAASATFASPNVGNNQTVAIAGLTITGAQSLDYTIVQPSTTADILPQQGTVSDGGSSVLTIVLATNQTLAIVSNGTSYAFTSNQSFTPTSGTNPVNQSTAFSGFGTTMLSLTSVGLAQYTTAIRVLDNGAGASVTFSDSGTKVYVNNFNVDLTNSGAGAITFNGASNFGNYNLQASTTLGISVNVGATLTTTNGNLKLQANLQPLPTAGSSEVGVTISSATVGASGTGLVTIQGRGGSTGFLNSGVAFQGTATIKAGTGSISIFGTGGATSNGIAYGVDLGNGFSSLTSNGGNINIVGQGGGSGANQNNEGVAGTSVITAGGFGNILVQGTGGSTSTAQGNGGVSLDGTITSSRGDILIMGQGGSPAVTDGAGSFGVALNGLVSAGGTGRVTVLGTGGSSGIGEDIGVQIDGAATKITSHGGDVRVIGQGGYRAGPNSYGNVGISMSEGEISAGGSGSVLVQGIGGLTAGGYDAGIWMDGASGSVSGNALITSGGGNVQVLGQAGGSGSSSSNIGLYIGTNQGVSGGASGDGWRRRKRNNRGNWRGGHGFE